ncbi:MAG: glycosyltransferase family 1 protein [Gemmatimonadales bacterium]|nr:MAG: glycosyltransferase family 1 protein [Gemmatimonadales bacterium]
MERELDRRDSRRRAPRLRGPGGRGRTPARRPSPAPPAVTHPATPQPPDPVRLRPLLFTPWYRPDTGGVASVAERLHEGLRRSGVDSRLVVFRGGRDLEPHAELPGVWSLEIPTAFVSSRRPRAWLGALLRGPGTIRRLVRFIREREVNCLVVVYPIDHAWIFPLLRRFSGARLFPSFHGGDAKRIPDLSARRRWIFRRLVAASDGIIVCAEHLEEKTRERCPEAEAPIRVIANAVDVDHFVPPPADPSRSDGPRTLVHVSNFFRMKRTLDIVEGFALADLPPGTRLVMVGDGDDRLATQARAEELGVADRVEFPGFREDIRPYLQQADVFVLASDSEGAPLVLLEAMACGTPWVSTPWGAAAEIPSGECGLVVPARDPARLAAALSEIMADDARRLQMGARARELAVANYGSRAWIRRHVEFMGGTLPDAEPVPDAPPSTPDPSAT